MAKINSKLLLNLKNSIGNYANISRRHISGMKLEYTEYGDPLKVIEQKEDTVLDAGPKQIVVRMLAAPINPADINTIQGKYPSKPSLPAVAGNEGVGEVIGVGRDVTSISAGDRVVPLTGNLGTWRTHLTMVEGSYLKIPKNLGVVEACALTVNPCTAYRMIKDFVNLDEGDVIIQNGGNSAVGQNVIQLAKIWGLKTVNIVRDRPKLSELKSTLLELGATEILTEEELRKTDLFRSGKLPKPKLGLNCVGGKNALEVMRHLGDSAPFVTYGGMSREPVTVPTSALIFKDIQVRGFWMTAWSKKYAACQSKTTMFEELIGYMINKQLLAPVSKMVKFNNYKEALMNTMTIQGMADKKYVLEF